MEREVLEERHNLGEDWEKGTKCMESTWRDESPIHGCGQRATTQRLPSTSHPNLAFW
jgi:hypothetical protein